MPEAKIIRIGAKSTAADTDILNHMRRLLAQLGLSSDSETVEPGDATALRRALAGGLRSCNVVITIGSFGHYGIGGAKETIFKALEIPFEPVDQVKNLIRKFAQKERMSITPELEALWMMPRDAEAFPSANGVDSGFAIAAGGQCILMLPASPESFHPMATGYALPYLAGFFGLTSVRHRLSCFGMNQKSISDELYGDILKDDLPLVFPVPSRSSLEAELWITASAASTEQAEELCQPVIGRIREQLGDVVYACDMPSMEQYTLSLLKEHQKNLCIGESFSSGMLYQLLHKEAGMRSPITFAGSYMTPAETSELGLPYRKLKGQEIVTPTGAGMLAEYIRRQGDENSLGLSLCLDEPVRQVYVSLSDGQQVYFRMIPLPDDCFGSRAAEYGSLCAMNLLSTYLTSPEKLPTSVPVRLAAAGKGFPEAEDPNWAERLGHDNSPSIARRLVMLLCVVLFALGATFLGFHYHNAMEYEQQNQQLQTLYAASSSTDVEPPEDYPAEYLAKFSDLYQINPDIQGWLSIEGTSFSYPVVQSDEDTSTSQYYLRRDFHGAESDHGVPFLDYRASVKLPSDNLVIYGHNMRDGQMFEELLNYKKLDYYRAHPIIRFDSVYEEAEYKVLAMFITNTQSIHGDVFDYHNFINAESDEDFDRYLYSVQIRSILNTGVDVGPGDQLLTLSTCSYEFEDARFVVIARKVRDGEDAAVDTARASENENVLYPDIWYSLYKTEKPNVSLMRAILPSADRSITVPTIQMTYQPETAPIADLLGEAPDNNIADYLLGLPLVEENDASEAPENFSEAVSSESSSAESSSAVSSESVSVPVSSAAPSSSSSSSSAASSVPLGSAAPSSSAVSSSTSLEAPPEEIIVSGTVSEAEPSSASSSSASSSKSSASSSKPSSSSSRVTVIPIPGSSSESSSTPWWEEEGYEDWTETESSSTSSEKSSSKSSSSSKVTSSKDDEEDEDYEIDYDDTLSVTYNGKKQKDSAYEILCKVVMAEIGSSKAEAVKAQAVAAYTYIKHENARGVSPSVAMKTPTTAVKKAVTEVLGEAVYYKGSLAFTCYHATSAGRTNSSAEVWGGSYPYLISVDSSVDVDAYQYEATKRISADAVAEAVDEQLGIELDGDPEDWFEVISYTSGGYNNIVSVGGKTKYNYNGKSYNITGRVLREAVLGLRSACFEIDYNDSRDEFIFTTYGYGHGVGLSQTGAMLLAAEGWDYIEILEHYYPGTTVK